MTRSKQHKIVLSDVNSVSEAKLAWGNDPINPWGPPPPYHPGHPGHPGYPGYPNPPAPGYTYVPAPVVMPVYPVLPQPVPQPQPVAPPQPAPAPQPYTDPLEWVPATGFSAPGLVERAFVAGKEGWDSSPLCVIRAHHSGELVPGKLAIKHRSAYIPHGGKEVPVNNFEVLCVPDHIVQWVPSSHGGVPPDAIIAGNSHNAEPLYICRVRHLKSITPGKVHPSHGCAYISFGGSEHVYKHYEVLCRNPNSHAYPPGSSSLLRDKPTGATARFPWFDVSINLNR